MDVCYKKEVEMTNKVKILLWSLLVTLLVTKELKFIHSALVTMFASLGTKSD
jgi:hypothetical protein